jgi:hypothetical protein
MYPTFPAPCQANDGYVFVACRDKKKSGCNAPRHVVLYHKLGRRYITDPTAEGNASQVRPTEVENQNSADCPKAPAANQGSNVRRLFAASVTCQLTIFYLPRKLDRDREPRIDGRCDRWFVTSRFRRLSCFRRRTKAGRIRTGIYVAR